MIEKHGEETYLKIDDEKNLLQLNKQLYYFAKSNDDDVIGLKKDLDELIKMIKKSKKNKKELIET